MADPKLENGESIEVLGTCMTNTEPGSQHVATVEYRHLWSYAQQAALIAVCEKKADQCYHLVLDPERRAKRIAAHYADLYFRSAEKSQGKLQFLWPALAAFVVKDIVEAFRFAREEVLHNEWNSPDDAARNNVFSSVVSSATSSASPQQHALRTYIALAKGNLWLFMDVYPWLWFFLEYGIHRDSTLVTHRLNDGLAERAWDTFQIQSKTAVEELPYGPNWLDDMKAWLAADPVYAEAHKFFDGQPIWTANNGYGGAHAAAAFSAHRYVKANAHKFDQRYRTPPGPYWNKFRQAFYVMEAERSELMRIAEDDEALAALVKARQFRVTPEVEKAYEALIKEHRASEGKKAAFQKIELEIIAKQEQVNVLQPLIYNDVKLQETLAAGHRLARLTGGWISPEFKVVYSAAPATDDPNLEAVFDAPDGIVDRLTGAKKNLANQDDRMAFVDDIAKRFNDLMTNDRPYMEGELRTIRKWINA